MYFTPDGRHAIVVAERLHRLDFRNPHTFALQRSLTVPCVGIDHMDFSADGAYLIASCEFSGRLVKVDLRSDTVAAVMTLPDGGAGMPQDVKLSADGRVFYVADNRASGVWMVDGDTMHVSGFVHTGAGAHGLYPSRDGKFLYVTNRVAGSISVISFATRKLVATWQIPGGGSPDMGGVTANGRVLWVSGRYNGVVYALSTRTGQLLARIPSARARTGCASGRNPADIRSVTPGTCGSGSSPIASGCAPRRTRRPRPRPCAGGGSLGSLPAGGLRTRVDNPWFPLRPGTAYVYRGSRTGKPSRDVVTVSGETRRIEGVRATRCRDRLYLEGRLAERTTDWYAQDRAGNVWYLGEATAELDAQRHVTSRAGGFVARRRRRCPSLGSPCRDRPLSALWPARP